MQFFSGGHEAAQANDFEKGTGEVDVHRYGFLRRGGAVMLAQRLAMFRQKRQRYPT
jgi:hypothetical protein